jgi:hypothetical protein
MTFTYPRCAAIRVDDYSKPYRNEVVRYTLSTPRPEKFWGR